jgi:hypothetical protein
MKTFTCSITHRQIKRSRRSLMAILIMIAAFHAGVAYGFDSGSTGADGPFAPSSNTTLTLPPSGIFNFTTITIPAGVTVTFTKNATNTPVIMLASGNVSISGTIDVRGSDSAQTGTAGNGSTADDGVPGEGGPGGFRGGAGGLGAGFGGSLGARGGDGVGPGGGIGASLQSGTSFPGGAGGAGFASTGNTSSDGLGHIGGAGGAAYGTTRLLPLIGGSGGGGGGGGSGYSGSGGGGGGGAILIASSGTINFISGSSILADGGNAGSDLGTNCGGMGGAGSGGAIRLIAHVISGTGTLNARGSHAPFPTICSTSFGGGGGSDGRISLEADNITFSGSSTPSYLPGTIGQVFAPGLPTLAITNIGGVSAPSAPSGSFATPDITLPIGTTSPVTVSLAAANIPVGTVISVTRFLERGAKASVNSTALSGADDSATTATANISLSSGVTAVVQASATFTVQTASNPFPVYAQGEKVEKIRVAATFGGQSTIYLITESGKEIPYNGAVAE